MSFPYFFCGNFSGVETKSVEISGDAINELQAGKSVFVYKGDAMPVIACCYNALQNMSEYLGNKCSFGTRILTQWRSTKFST
jgi:UDP-2,3-diacylglucosamine pyrophosphatase LpxH